MTPDWLRLPPAPGTWESVAMPVPALGDDTLAVRVWSPETTTDRVLVAHDGPEYDQEAQLGQYAAAMIAAGRVPPFHLVLLPPGEARLERYSCSVPYARTLTAHLVPKLAAGAPVVGAGVSLGALAMLHAQRRHPAAFAGLFLQSGSYFQPRFDRQEAGFERYQRIVRFVRRVRRGGGARPVPIAMTCGDAEENLANNRDMAHALRSSRYPVDFAEVPGGHTWPSWRNALDPHLTSLLHQVWS